MNICLASMCTAQTVYPGAGGVTPLSALGASARGDALGGALAGLADDSAALFYNCAGLSRLPAASLSLHHNSYLAGSFEETLLFGIPAGSLGGFGVALQYVAWEGLEARDAFGVSQGVFADSDVALSVGWGLSVAKGISLGVALHGFQQKIVDSLYNGLSGDLGILWAPLSELQVGLVYTGLGTPQAGFIPVQDLRLGLSGLLTLGKKAFLRPLLEGDWEPRGVSRIQGGLEAVVEKDFSVRLGYQAPLEDNQTGGLSGFTAGAGFGWGSLRLDYAFVPYGDLGTSHRISVGYEFPNPPPSAVKPVTVMANPVTVFSPPVTVVATPAPLPVSAAGVPKSKVEVLFELPGTLTPPMGSAQASALTAPYEKAAQENPGDSLAWRKLGIIYLRTGQRALGIQCLEQALRLNPRDLALKQWLEKDRVRHPNGR